MHDELNNRLAEIRQINDEAAEKQKAKTAARIEADKQAADYLAENRLYLHGWLDGMDYKDPKGGPCVQKLYMAHKKLGHVTARGDRSKDDLIASLLLLTTEHELKEFPWQ